MAHPSEEDPQVEQMFSAAKRTLETAKRLLAGEFDGREGEQALRDEMGYHKDGHLYVNFAFANEAKAPVLAVADSPKEALDDLNLFGGVIYRYYDVAKGEKLNIGYIVTAAELKNLVARARPEKLKNEAVNSTPRCRKR